VPARKGFFRRLIERIGEFFEGPPEKPLPPPPPNPPPSGPDYPAEDQDVRIWRQVVIGDDRINLYLYDEWHQLFLDSVAALELDNDEREDFWEKFLRSFYLTTRESGHIRRSEYYADLGVRQRDYDLDWEEWRELKRGTP
jgi:hypothetical protein